jgi:hypothetical protein
MHNLKYRVAKLGFRAIKPWIVEQFAIDEDDVLVQEILNDVIEEALKEAGVEFEEVVLRTEGSPIRRMK